MAARSIIVDVRRAVVAEIADRVEEQVSVTYGWDGSDERRRREQVFTDRPRASHDPAALKAGRNFRDERMEFDVVVLVAGVGLGPEDTDVRALEIGADVEGAIADNKSNELGVDGLNWIRVTRMELNNRFAPNGSLTEITYTLLYDARLT